jgi:multisite-specific tRNA:(cytosine-C5)-methyltransferase
MRRDLPNSFRFTGSRSHALAVQTRLKDFYIPEITAITFDGQYVPAPEAVSWYPDQLAWFMTTPKHIIRKFPPFKSFQNFLVTETEVGNITRQEIVSMIPPLVMDIKPGMTVLDLCAAPGSKSAQLIEMIHAGEEERAREVAHHLANGLDRPQGDEYKDDGRSTGLLIANDVDYKRAHMLVHQVKRLASPNIIVMNHDATVFPSIKIPSLPAPDGRPPQNRYLKFDRILADVPCSGDGTTRKNLEIWNKWSPSNGLGLHATQIRILIRALQMLKVGGRVVYSTCSMNPVEDEAVVAAAIEKCGGQQVVDIVETKDYLPGLKRSPGLRKWSVMDKTGRIWDDYESILKHKQDTGDNGLAKLTESMFAPKLDLPLDRAMRIYPHSHDTGAFFITILEKKSEVRVRNDEKSANSQEHTEDSEVAPNRQADAVAEHPIDAMKRKTDETDESPQKRAKIDEDASDAAANGAGTDASLTMPNSLPAKPMYSTPQTQPTVHQSVLSKGKVPFEEPFKYLSPIIPELEQIQTFYTLHPSFPRDRFLVRNNEGTASKNIYYTTALAKDILIENEGRGLKFVHGGVKMFVKQDAPAPDVCPWRIQTDGLRIVEMWVGKDRIVKLWRKETLRKLLIEMFPKFHGEEYKNLGEVGEQIRDMRMGCCVMIVEPTPEGETRNPEDGEGLLERMVFPLWKSIQSVNLMLPKEERKALLLRLFNDESDLINLKQNPGGIRPDKKENVILKTEDTSEDPRPNAKSGEDDNPLLDGLEAHVERVRRNSSSVEGD